MRTQRGAEVPTNCLTDSYCKSGGIARGFGSSAQSGRHLPGDARR